MKSEAGAFLRASRIIAAHSGNITRVNYNKSVDEHTLFIDVEAPEAAMKKITADLAAHGFLSGDGQHANVILVEFTIPDEPGRLVPILETIEKHRINITYINSEETKTGFQYFKMGLYITDAAVIKQLLDEVSACCKTRIIEYEPTEKILDNTVFYLSFAADIAAEMLLDKADTDALIVESNRIMQMLDDAGEQPYKTFEYINRFADKIAACRGADFNARISHIPLDKQTVLHIIEPPCGSNTYIFECGDGSLLFIDCGFACYRREMLGIFNLLFADFSSRRRELILTHPDTDHCGLWNIFSRVYLSYDAWRCFELQNEGAADFREQNGAHAPYSRICKILTNYVPPVFIDVKNDKIIENSRKNEKKEAYLPEAVVFAEKTQAELTPLENIGQADFAGHRFDIYAGSGGHVAGEIIIVCEEYKLVFCGDVYVNVKGFTPQQYEFNRIAPYLMTNVDTDKEKADSFRRVFLNWAQKHAYKICSGHGAAPEEVPEERKTAADK